MVKRLSKTGVAFAALFAAFCLWCVISFLKGAWQATDVIAYVTFPFSLAVHYGCSFLQSLFRLSYGAINGLEVALDAICGTLEAYFFGWLLERPLRR